QRPEPPEGLPSYIFAIFKVRLSLFFSAQFFIDYLTLPGIVDGAKASFAPGYGKSSLFSSPYLNISSAFAVKSP
ncbi:hypothetical protein ACTNAL_07525, partial [Bariatricus sp. HCP28S3_B10]|uniref:hypothetical protein n=1 Tax=unclassified Bariatricus TaxID=2677046 RepID=UPI003F88D839